MPAAPQMPNRFRLALSILIHGAGSLQHLIEKSFDAGIGDGYSAGHVVGELDMRDRIALALTNAGRASSVSIAAGTKLTPRESVRVPK